VTSYDTFPDDLLAAVPELCFAVGEHRSIHEANSHYLPHLLLGDVARSPLKRFGRVVAGASVVATARQLPISPLSRGGIACD
jgi:hypothetical protein